MKKRVAAIDYGEKRIGIAISDPSGRIALPLTQVAGGKQALSHIEKALASYKNDLLRIVVGLPLLLSGQESEMTKKVRLFGEELEKFFSLPVVFVDERLSSKQADKQLKELSYNRKKRNEKIDIVSAALLLQHHLDGAHI